MKRFFPESLGALKMHPFFIFPEKCGCTLYMAIKRYVLRTVSSAPPPPRNVSAHEQDRKGLQVQQSTKICVPIWQTGCKLQEGRTHTHLSRSPLDLHSCPGAWQRAAPKNVGWFSEKGRRNRWTWGTPNSWRRPKDHLDDLRRN